MQTALLVTSCVVFRQAGARVLCCRSAAELRGRDPEDLGRWGTMLSLDNEARCTV